MLSLPPQHPLPALGAALYPRLSELLALGAGRYVAPLLDAILGASMEADLRIHAEGGFVCLHDVRLDRETTGTGPVAEASIQTLRKIKMRREDGHPSEDRLMLLDDLVRLASGPVSAGTLIQLDLKEEYSALDEAIAAQFRRSVTPIAGRCVLTGGDWAAVRRLAAGVVGLRCGFDPCAYDTLEGLRESIDVAKFVGAALAAAPEATMIYLDYRIVLAADAIGSNPIRAFHAAGKAVDAWTLSTNGPQARVNLQRLVTLGVDQITTDEPIALQDLFYDERPAASQATSGTCE